MLNGNPTGESRLLSKKTKSNKIMSKRELLARTLEKTGLGRLLSQSMGRWNGLVVFNYHRLGNPADSPFDRALFSAGQEEFEQQVRFLKKNYDVLHVADLDQALSRRGRSVMLTFDDGYRDNYELAFPVLKQCQIPATFFITSGFIDETPVAWWDEIAWMVRHSPENGSLPETKLWPAFSLASVLDRDVAIPALLRRYKQLSSDQTTLFLEELAVATASGRCPRQLASDLWMNWDMIREMDQAGMDVGGHTMSHPVLANISVETQNVEITGSKSRIEEEIGHAITAFSYPVGHAQSFTANTKQILQAAGYRWAFSFSGGFQSTGTADDFDLPRIAVSPHVSQALFQSTARLPWLFA